MRCKLPEELTDKIRDLILDEMNAQRSESEKENAAQTRRKQQLENEQAKFLEAHHADAIPLELMKKEQARITIEIETADRRIAATNLRFDQVEGTSTRRCSSQVASEMLTQALVTPCDDK